MRNLTDSEMIALRELLQVETNSLAKAQASQALITDEDLKIQAQSSITACKGRINGLRQFITENGVISESNTGDVLFKGGID